MLPHANNLCLWPFVTFAFLYTYPILAGFNCLSNPCIHGVCIDDLNTSYSCFCIDGYTGIHCQTNWDECWSNPCQNGGTCHDGIAMFNCSCPAGYIGEFCEKDFDECESNPCLNNGTCIDISNGYSCVCPAGYSGIDCEIDVAVCNATNETRCANGGVCIEGPGLSFTCRCPSGWEGYLCQSEVDECMSAPCQNGGVCVDLVDDYVCACLFGFTGKDCHNVILHCEDNYCQNGALCLTEEGRDVCYCVPDYHGDRCQYQYDECQLGLRCKNGGTCIDGIDSFSCSCPPSLTGLYCECLISSNDELDCNYTLTTILTTHLSAIDTSSTITEYITTSSSVPNVSTTFLYTSQEQSTQNTDTTVEEITTFIPSRTEEIMTSETTSQAVELETTTLEIVPSTNPTYSTMFQTEFRPDTTLPIELTTIQIIPTWSSFLTQEPTTAQQITTVTEASTTLPENITDCIQSSCRNGGSCVFTPEGYKCMCPYDAEGPFCEIQLGIKNAAFGGDSYLTHRLVNTTHTDIEFTTRTLSQSGLIFYSNIDATYMTLFLERGYLKFIFSCGYQTMLLSELSHAVNDGYDMILRTKLEYSKDLNRCSAVVVINNTLTMSGNQTAVVNKLIKPISVLHLGGLPHEKFKEHLFPSTGFMGCVSNLKISEKKVDIFKGAEDGFKISECESLVCLSNPCTNGGTCVETDNKWHCTCKNGYVGKLCEVSVCDNNPCMYGATCLPFTGSGYICLCPFGRHGHFCENELETNEPYFSSSVYGYSSYAAYTIPLSGLSNSMELKLTFIPNTMDQISILAFIGQTGQHDSTSDHVAVSFVKGYVMLTWNLGSGPRRIFTSKPLVTGKSSYLLQFGRLGRRAWLAVDNLGNVTGRSPGNLVQLDVDPVLYLGGHVSPNFSTLPHDLPLHSGFSGCIYDVELKSGNLVVPIQSSRHVIGRAVGQCGTNECHEKLCRNDGACLHHGGTFTCLCQDGWFGPLCSSKYNPCDYHRTNCTSSSVCVPLLSGYECDCAVGKSGKYCDKEEILSDISFSGIRSYALLKEAHFEISKFTIELELRPLGEKGLILFIGSNDNSFLSLNMQSRLLELKVLATKRRSSTSEIVNIRSNVLLAMGTWYNIKMGKFGNKIYLYVDDAVNTGLLSNGYLIGVSGQEIFLGGLPDLSLLPKSATSNLPLPFTGCMRQLKINSQHLSLTRENIKNGRNIADCDGTPCGDDACENGGTCWIDSNLNQHCSCPEPYVGERCELLPSCEEKICKNKGRCVGNKCFCLLGFTGAFCETRIKVRTPDFTGDSYLVLNRFASDKKRDLSNLNLSALSLNFSTANENGLILWSEKNGDFFGVGLEKGYLKMVYSEGNKTVVEIPGRGHLADGSWHNLEVNFDPNVEMRVDRKMLYVQNKKKRPTSNRTFYLGGVPNNNLTNNRTFGMFKESFVGCIQAITFNKEKSITDFSACSGENVGACNVF